MPRGAPPWTTTEDDRLRALHRDGLSLHAIAKAMGRSKDTVSRHAAALGLTWDRAKTAAAAEAVVVDNRARRVKIVGRLYDEADALLTAVEDGRTGKGWRTLLKAFGGAEHEESLGFIPPVDRRTTAEALSRLLMAAGKLEAIDATDGVAAERSLLADLGRALGVTGLNT